MCSSLTSAQRAVVPSSSFDSPASFSCSSTMTPVPTTPIKAEEPTDALSSALSALSFIPLDSPPLSDRPALLPSLSSSSSIELTATSSSTGSSSCSDCSDCARKSELRDIEEIHLDLIAQANGKAHGGFPGFPLGSVGQGATAAAGVGGRARKRREGKKTTDEST
ncbi:hypothetical protein [Phaffia rhodozyma]|uniref:Uncharacterized protein n=1 Tax=Phaffia rhodozyma TaxID=264483 RepID=A0A0F7SMX9_PHARH|nr:hypothetical protein [Phaffia rhodozyma]